MRRAPLDPTAACHRARTRIVAILGTLAMVAAGLTTIHAVPASAAITTPFAKMFSVNASGNIQIRGNTVMTCQTAATKCAAARNSTLTGGELNNNSFFMTYVDVDGDSGTFDSSSATVAVPAGASVLYAALTWGGSTVAGGVIDSPAFGTGTPAATPTPANAGQVKLKIPGAGSSYQTVSSTRTTFILGSTGAYQGFADVTSIITAAGNGSYTVGNVQSGTGGNQYAGWALTVAYANPADPPRNLSIFAGFGTVVATNTVDITVTGFQTPLTGDVKTTLGAISYEGDAGSVGDQLQLGNTVTDLQNVKDTTHPVANTFISAISDNGVDGSTRDPSFKNQLGYDQATFVIDPAAHYLKNDASSAVIRLTSGVSGETYYPGIVTFATELYSPNLVATKSAAVVAKAPGNIQPGLAEPGDTLRYQITGVNTGKDDAVGTVMTDAIPTGTTYVPGSLTVNGAPRTDAAGDDVGSFAASPPVVRVNLGTGAGNGTTPADGGTVLIGAATAPVTFDVTINSNIADGAPINNQAQLTYRGFLNNLAVSGASNAVTAAVVRRHSELAVTKTADLPLVQKGAATPVTYTLTATNSGPYDDPGVTITDALPAGATLVRATPSAGSCALANPLVCNVGALANGRFATVVVELLLDSAADPATDTVTVAGQNVDDDPSDSSASLSTAVNTAPAAANDSVTTSGGAATIDVRANDNDVDGDSLTVTPGSVAPAKGSVVVNADQTVTYTASFGTAGPDTFTYTLSDGRGGTATATVQITIPNSPPQAEPDATTTTPLTPVIVTVLDNDTDVNIPTAGQTLSVTGVGQPAGGQGVVTTNGSTVTFQPAASFVKGTATFTYTVSDGAGGSDLGTVSVTIPDASPVAADDTEETAYLTPVTVDVLANDSDDNGDPLTVTSVVGATHGTATVTGTGDGARVRYTPEAGWSGPDTMTYTITDGTTSTTAELTVTTLNGIPTADSFSVSVDGETATVLDLLGHADDPNGGPLTLVGAGGASHGSVGIDTDGQVSYVSEAGYVGPDSFEYTVSDGQGGEATGTVSVTVRNQGPTATDNTVLVPVNRSVAFNVLTDDTDPNTDELTVTGTSAPTYGTATFTAAGVITYTPNPGYLGDDTFTYDISDGRGGTDTATVSVTVANQAPLAVDDEATAGGPVGSPISIDVLANDSDPNDDPLTVDAVSTPAHGTATVEADGSIRYDPNDDYAGIDIFTYTVSDGRAGLSTATIRVDVRNRRPVAVDDSATASSAVATEIDVLRNDTDPDGEDLTLASVDPASAQGGVVSLTPDGVSYTSAAGFTGQDTFSYTVIDPRGGTASAEVTVTVGNADPLAPDRELTTTTAGGTLDLLAGASDPDGQPVTVSSVGAAEHGVVTLDEAGVATYTPELGYSGEDAFSYTVDDGNGGTATGTVTVTVSNQGPTASDFAVTVPGGVSTAVDVLSHSGDPNDDPLTVSQVEPAGHGSVAINEDGQVIYTPEPGYSGEDSFTYTVDDGNGGTATGTVTVTVSNQDPTASDFAVTVPGRVPTVVDVLAHSGDPNDDPLSVTGLGSAEHGTVEFNEDGQVVYTPDAGYAGEDAFSYTVSDGNGGTATGTVTVTVSNQDPTADDFAATVPGGVSTVVDVLAHSGDPNDDPLTVSVLGLADHGTVVIDENGQVVYTPNAGYAGDDAFSYTVDDGNGGTATGTVTVTVSNQDPTASDFAVTVPGGVSTVVDVLSHSDDPNDDPLTVTGLGSAGHGTVEFNLDGEVVYTPEPGYSGGDAFSYTVSDGNGGTATGTVTVTVSNQDPTASDFAVTVPGGVSTVVDVLAHSHEPNDDPLTVSEVGAPGHGTIVINEDGQVVYTPNTGYAGEDSFSYTVDDGNGGTATGTVTVTVSNQDPTAGDFAVTVPGGVPTVVDVLSHSDDPNDDPLTVTGLGSAGHGTVEFNLAGEVVYTPEPGYSGGDAFTYTVSDGNGGTATGTVTVTVSNQDPTASDFGVTVDRGVATVVDVLSHSSDPNSDPLTVTEVGTAEHGTVAINGNGEVVYTPDAGYAGEDSFTYTVSDGMGGTATGAVTVTVGNAPPVAADDAVTVGLDGSVTIDVLANDTDPNGDDTLTVTITRQPAHGTTVIDGRFIIYTPYPGYTGVDSFDYAVSDGFDTANATVTVTVIDDSTDPGNPDDDDDDDSDHHSHSHSHSDGSDDDGDDLADTGGPSLGYLGLGAGSVLLGLAFLDRGRRRTVRR